MKTNAIRILGISLILLVAAVFSASAMPQGRQVPLDKNVIQYFANNGVDPTYLDKATADIPSDVLAKIASLTNTPDLTALVLSDLRVDIAAFGNTLYLKLGNTIFEYSRTMSGGDSFSVVSAS